MNGKNLFVSVLITAGVFASSSHQAVAMEVRGKADVPFKTGLFSADPDAALRQKAIEAARLSAWKRYTSTFNPAKLKSYMAIESAVLSALDEYVIDVVILDEVVNKDSSLYSVAVRASINEAALNARLNASGAVAADQSNTPAGPFSFIFVAREVESVKAFDARRTEIRSEESELAARQSGAARGGAAAVDESSKSMTKVTTGGSSLRKADEVKYRVRSGADIDAAMTETLSGYGFEVVGYPDIVANCGGTSPEIIKKEFSDSAEMTVESRKRAIDAARLCEVGFFALGTLDVGMHDVDPVTGNQRVHVSVRGQVWDISARLPRRVASVGPVQFAGLGPNPEVAMRNALRLSAEQGAKVIVDQLNSKGLR